MSEHKCRHGGWIWRMTQMADGSERMGRHYCGEGGWRCDACKEDGANRRAVLQYFRSEDLEMASPLVALHWLATGEWPDD